MLDTARNLYVSFLHFLSFFSVCLVLNLLRISFPLSDIERTLDAMSWVHVRHGVYSATAMGMTSLADQRHQLNTFHWHIVDSQSFPLVVPDYTEIAQHGAYGTDAVYTPQDVAHIVSYAGAVRFFPRPLPRNRKSLTPTNANHAVARDRHSRRACISRGEESVLKASI